ncbi:O-antigen ligase family protein [Puia sp. P3]|uniref:O-antigen ligase family protein n=1 Tax=Puia sp. P3 TaxID=3423952 RepID=UPI003D66F914
MRSLLLLDPAAKIFSLRERLLYFGIALFFVSMFLPDMPVINNIIIGGVVLVSFLYNPFSEKVRLFVERKEIILMVLFYIWHIISTFLSVNRHEALVMLALRVPLLVFPVSIGLLHIREELKDRILLAFIIIITATAAVCFIYSVTLYRRSGDTGLLYNDSLTSLIHVQSIYFALIVNLALFSYFYLLRKGSFAIEYIGLAYLSIAFLLVFHFMLASRIAIISLYSVFLYFGIMYMLKRKLYLGGGVIILGLVIGTVILVKVFPKTVNRFNELHYTEYQFNNHNREHHYNMELTPEQWNGANLRLALWACGEEVARRYWLFGAQLGDKQDQLYSVYREKKFDYAVQSKKNMHNNYIDVFCTFGLIGFVVFLCGYVILPMQKAIRNRNLLGGLMVGFLAISMFSETYMDRSMGCLLLGFFLSFISAWRRNTAPPAAHTA